VLRLDSVGDESINQSINLELREIDSNEKQDINVRLRATLRGDRLTTAAFQKQYYIFWVCIFSLSYPACKEHAPYCHLWHVRLCVIFPHYPINGTVFRREKKRWTQNVFWFPLQLSSVTFLILITVRDMINVKYPLLLSDLNKNLNFMTDFNENWIFLTDFNEN
jgi:hypothetical protein